MNSDLPKVLQPLAGQPLLQHVIHSARSLHPGNIYVVYGHGGAQVQAALPHEPVDWILQAEQLGTGHAVMQAMPVIADDHRVLVLYGDVPLIRTKTLAALLAAAGDGSMAVLSAILPDPTGYGRIVRGVEDDVRAIVEQRDATPKQLAIHEINTGLMAIPAKRLREWLMKLRNDNAQHEYYLTDIVAAAVQGGSRVSAVIADSGEVMGVNDKIQLAQAEAHCRRERAQELMLAGVTLADPARIDIRGEVLVGRDVFIDVNAVLIGKVRLGNGVKIGPNCVIDSAVIADNCRIGPFARLRPGTVLHRGVHIGNFVEVKNSEIGADSRANHLTYLGDSRVGSDVNVGAGSITCNYDGENKWPTVIGDGAFIGSGSMLVAPVRIGANATVGAGSTIVQNAPDGQLTLTRAKQTTVAGWKPPGKLDDEAKAAAVDQALGEDRQTSGDAT